MTRISGFLIDLGGVVYQGDHLIEGSAQAIEALRAGGIRFRFLTNTTSAPRRSIVAKLAAMGMDIEPQHVFTPAMAARHLITARGLKPHFLVAPALMEDFADLPAGDRPAVVLGDAGDDFTYAALNAAFRLLEDGADFIALAKNRKFAGPDGKPCLDTGAFVAALEYASGREAEVIGKPAPDFFHAACADMGLDAAETAMIGDDAEFDASAAVACGLTGVLVHTGKWAPGAADGLTPAPSMEVKDLRAAVDRLALTLSQEGGSTN
ncbi:TIGR01458 family HAD-type hydrolase [Oricola sp.]|uniref:TIGR01458 family HAD-type hydrolase n=1 Tax=Oricola sp. TaxID=1979950 RepID=UPI0025E0F206|nr:TIGR01458 family HAD-type hydrolase [Oricola sp.]MCI5073464.1 TIGR01458 family HAD-type hydrolase [Oricola sp.]